MTVGEDFLTALGETPSDVPTQAALGEDFLQAIGQEPVQEDPGFFGGVRQAITGEERITEETIRTPIISEIPELNKMSIPSFKAAFGTTMATDDEAAQILKSNFPDIQVRKDDKGNIFVRSAEDNQEYLMNKPGLDFRDVVKTGLSMAPFVATGGTGGMLTRMGIAGLTQAGVESAQELAGGEFDVAPIAGAAVGETIGPVVGRALQTGKRVATGITRPVPGAREAVVETAERMGVQPLTSDVVPPETLVGKGVQKAQENIPFVGTAPLRETQKVQRTEAVKNTLREMGADDIADASEDVMEDIIKKRGQDLTKYSTAKKEVIERLSGEDKVIPVVNAEFEIEKQIRELQKLNTKGVRPLVDMLEDYRMAFKNQNLGRIETLRKQLSEELKDPSLASIRSQGEKSARKIYSALNNDMGDFIEKTGSKKDFLKWKVANKRLADMQDDMRVTTLKSTLKRGDKTPEEVRKLLFAPQKSKLTLLKKGLTPEGRKRAKVAVIQEITERAGGLEDITPKSFIRQMKARKMREPINAFLNKEDKKVLKGLVDVLELTKRAEDVTAKTGGQTLKQLIGPGALILGSGAVGGPGTAAGVSALGTAATGTIAGLSRLYESRLFRNAMVRIADAPKSKQSEVFKKVAPMIQSQVQKLGEEND